MKLIIDIGNSNIKLGVFQNNKLLEKIRYNVKNKNELVSFFSNFPNINHIFFCGKSYKLNTQINNIIKDKNVSITHWKNIEDYMINVEYDKLNDLGFDRIGVSVGAKFLYPNYNNHLIIDIGSCITYDIVLNNNYKGGQISPGINLRLKSLSSFTTSLPDLQFSKPKKILGNSTIESIRSGVFFGVFDEIKSRIEFHKKLTPKLNVILTGGDALHFKKTIKNVIFDDNLLMKGLNLLLDYNVKK